MQLTWEQSHNVPVEVWRQRAPNKHWGHSVWEREVIEGQREEKMEGEEGGVRKEGREGGGQRVEGEGG